MIESLPEDFLCKIDSYVVNTVAESLARMQECQIKINEEGLFSMGGEVNIASKTFNDYSKIFKEFASKLGLSPKDRAQLSSIMLSESNEKNDPILKALQGD